MKGILLGVLINLISSALLSLGGALLGSSLGLDSHEVRPLEIVIGPIIINNGPQSTATQTSPPPIETEEPDSLTCTDAKGRKGVFQAMVFLDSYNWVRGSTELVEFHQKVIPYFPTVLREEPVQKVLNGAEQIVAVGTASCESRLGFLVENHRAQERAEQLVQWVELSRSRLPQSPQAPMRSVIPLNLGRFNQGCSAPATEETTGQRRIVLIAVTQKQKDLDLESCLEQRMKEDPSLKFLTENYSKFDLNAGW